VSLAIIIINFRTPQVTIDCLQSLASQIDDVPGTQVFLIDNASGDDSVPRLREAIEKAGWQRWITFTASPVNAGFAGGNNQGIKQILASATDFQFILLLNSDTIAGPNVLQYTVAKMRADAKIGIMSCLLLNRDQSVQNAARRLPTPLRLAARNMSLPWIFPKLFAWANLEDPDWDRRTEIRDVGWISGAFMLIRRELIDQLGGLDENFFFYGEDVEYCHRAWKNRWKVRYDPGAWTIHLGGASSDPTRLAARQRDALTLKARYLLQRRCYGMAAELFARGVDLFVCAFRCFKLMIRGRWKSPEFSAQRSIMANVLCPPAAGPAAGKG
jgi:GT2 family glycosyltransferase